ncbi:phosphate ABC transporter permease [Lacticaseibacillus paracasei subsp. paracasei Lpp70]|nr:phosphate ABC transporter permease [Lacticaseibacillus paracasei subsp. paracasei Lpp70]
MDPIREAMLKKSRSAKLEQRGKLISLLCISLIVIVVVAIFFFVASKGLATFFQNKINLWSFLSKSVWNPSIKDAHGNPEVGALPMIVGSFGVTFLSAIIATPFAVGAGIFYD